MDESELSNHPGKFYFDVSLENNPEALLGRQNYVTEIPVSNMTEHSTLSRNIANKCSDP